MIRFRGKAAPVESRASAAHRQRFDRASRGRGLGDRALRHLVGAGCGDGIGFGDFDGGGEDGAESESCESEEHDS